MVLEESFDDEDMDVENVNNLQQHKYNANLSMSIVNNNG